MKNKKPLVSVIIHSYNRFKFLLNAIKSVEIQNVDELELILLNDQSTQEEYYNHNFPNFVNKIDIDRGKLPNWTGSRQALINVGSLNARGKYLAFLDDDDIWLPDKLNTQIDLIEKNNMKFSSTEGFFGEGVFDENKNYKLYNSEHFYKILKKKYKKTSYLKNKGFPTIWDYDFLAIHNCVIKSSVVIEKNLFDSIGGFRGLPEKADYDLWLNILKVEDLLYVDKPLFYYDGKHGEGKNYN